MRLLISAGGTGGGVYPALSVAQTLLADNCLPNAAALLWIGGRGGMEAGLIERAGLPFEAISSAGLHGVGWRAPLNAWRLAWGFFQSRRLVRSFRPEVVLVTGGYLAVPVSLAAWLENVPVLIYLPDIEPALAVRLVSWVAARIAVTTEASRAYFPGGRGQRVTVTGYPVRPDLLRCTRDAGQSYFGLAHGRSTILVTGGSRGARSLNRAVWAALPDWLKDYQVMHITGQAEWETMQSSRDSLPGDLRAYYHAYPFLHEMGLALAAADLAVSRAGASVLGEYPLFGLPAVLVPYPYAWRYQKVNADYLAARGAAVRLDDDDTLPERLRAEVQTLLSDSQRLERMRAASRAAATPDAARRIGRELEELAGTAQRQGR